MENSVIMWILSVIGLAGFFKVFVWGKKFFYKPDISRIEEYISVGLYQEAIQTCDNEYSKVGTRLKKIEILSQKGKTYYCLAKKRNMVDIDFDINYYNRTLDTFRKAYNLAKYKKNKRKLPKNSKRLNYLTAILANMSEVYIRVYEIKGEREDFDAATRVMGEYRKYTEGISSKSVISMARINAARLQRKLYLMEHDIECISDAKEIYLEVISILENDLTDEQNRYPYYIACQNLTNILLILYKDSGEGIDSLIEAENYTKKAMAYFTPKEHPDEYARCCLNLANVYVELSRHKSSVEEKERYIEKALSLLMICGELVENVLGLRYESYTYRRNLSECLGELYQLKKTSDISLAIYQNLCACQNICLQIGNYTALVEVLILKIVNAACFLDLLPDMMPDLFDSFNKIVCYSGGNKGYQINSLSLLCQCASNYSLGFGDFTWVEKVKRLVKEQENYAQHQELVIHLLYFDLLETMTTEETRTNKNEIIRQIKEVVDFKPQDINSNRGKFILNILCSIKHIATINYKDENLRCDLEEIISVIESTCKELFDLDEIMFVETDKLSEACAKFGVALEDIELV